MRKAALLICIIVLSGLVSSGQNLLLSPAENTHQGDFFNGFAEHNNRFYLCGTQGYGQNQQSQDPVVGFCLQTDRSGTVIRRFNPAGFFSTPYVTVEAVGIWKDSVYLTGAYGYYDPIDNAVHFNKIFVMQLDTNFNANRLDTFSYGQHFTANIRFIKTLFLSDVIVMAYSSSLYQYYNRPNYSYLTLYDYHGTRKSHQPVDSVFLNSPPKTSLNEIVGASYHTDGSFLINFTNNKPIPGTPFAEFSGVTALIDTSLNILSMVDSLEYRPSNPPNNTVGVFYNQNLVHPNGTYFLGPSFSYNSILRLGLAKLNPSLDTVLPGPYLPLVANQDSVSSPAFKNALTLLRNQKEIVLLGNNSFTRHHQQSPSTIRVAKYDTSLNLLWHRTFGKANTSFIASGIYELQNGNLMIQASAFDYTGNTSYDFYAFILDSTGTPLSTFTLPNPSPNTVTAYPNPATGEIRFELPAGAAQAAYLLTDLQGKTVLSGTYFSGNSVPVSALPPATYLYKIRTADGVWHSGLVQKQ